MKRIKQEKGSMAAYTAIVLVSMLFILLAVFLTSSSKRRNQLDSTRAIRESYEYDVGEVNKIYKDLVSKQEIAEEPEQKEYVFDYTGAEQVFTAPADGVYKLQVWGAQGGSYNTAYAIGGLRTVIQKEK